MGEYWCLDSSQVQVKAIGNLSLSKVMVCTWCFAACLVGLTESVNCNKLHSFESYLES